MLRCATHGLGCEPQQLAARFSRCLPLSALAARSVCVQASVRSRTGLLTAPHTRHAQSALAHATAAPGAPLCIRRQSLRIPRTVDIPTLVSACTLQSRRPYQEDRYMISYLTPECSLFGCFDGHGGEDAAEFARQQMPAVFKQELVASSNDTEAALRSAFIKVDEDYIASGGNAGTTAVVAALYDDRLVIAHVGDSRAILCHEGQLVQLTQDHKPAVPAEEARIVKCGGSVTLDSDGTSRVNGRLAMSRSIGDPSLKESGVIAEPDILSREISEKDCFVVLMTDGVSDVLNSPQVCAVVNSCVDAEEAAQELVSLAAQLGSVDNITALVIRLPGWRKYDNPSDTHLRQQAYTYNRGGRFRPLSML